MSRGARLQICRTKDLVKPTEYVMALGHELKGFAFDEEDCLPFKGVWRSQSFNVEESVPMDLEIGTGNGVHFAHHAKTYPERCLVGIELKYKPMVQAIRRVIRAGGKNARIIRYNAVLLENLFSENEINDVIIHFPDPWEKLRQQKHRLIQDDFLEKLYGLQRKGSRLEFKTDSPDYFVWAMEKFKNSRYEIVGSSTDLHNSEYASKNFVTHFESIFLRQKLPINYCEMVKK